MLDEAASLAAYEKAVRERATDNLRGLHPLFTCLLANHVLKPRDFPRRSKRFEKLNALGELVRNDNPVFPGYLKQLVLNLAETPIHQCSMEPMHWYRFMMELGRKHKQVLFTNLRNRMASGDPLRVSSSNWDHLQLCAEDALDDFVNSFVDDETDKRDVRWKTHYPGTVLYVPNTGQRHDFIIRMERGEDLHRYFRVKPATAASAKSNIYFDDMVESLRREATNYYERMRWQWPAAIGLTNDQAVIATISHFHLWSHGFDLDFQEYVYLLHEHDLIKALSDLTKQIGIAHNAFLCLFVEGNNLQGRDTIPLDADAELSKLSKAVGPKGEDVRFEKGLIYSWCMQLFEEAMPEVAAVPKSERFRLFFDDLDSYWASRYTNLVNGAHHVPPSSSDIDITVSGPKTRMMFFEGTKKNFMYKTKPECVANESEKNETGRNRPIKSADTIFYTNEDYVQRVIDKYWTHSKVLLAPSLATHEEEAARIVGMSGVEYVSLDYKGMENQHSQRTLVEVCQAKCDFLGVPKYIADWLITAEKCQYLKYGDRTVLTTYGLMTGRRSTTFYNTILAYVYVRIALGDTYVVVTSDYYVGDDVIIRCMSRADARQVLKKALASRNTFNVHKQSWGYGAEFLRHAIEGRQSFGYINRSIASFVSGSWVNKLRLAETDIYSLFQRYAWTIDNRGLGIRLAHCYMSYPLYRRTHSAYSTCRSICAHLTAVNGGPVVPGSLVVSVVKPITEVVSKPLAHELPSHATDDYLSTLHRHVAEIAPREALNQVRRIFKYASYRKNLMQGFSVHDITYLTREVGAIQLKFNSKMLSTVPKGILAEHPTLPALRGILNYNQMQAITKVLTGKKYEGKEPLDVWLFGVAPDVIVADLGNNFDDLCQASKYQFYRAVRAAPYVSMARQCFY
jgi:hypothetical protein